jgi:hypothetical protein
MSRRTARRRQQAMNARRRKGERLTIAMIDRLIEYLDAPPRLRVITADPDTFPWFTGFGAGPVFRRMDGSAIGPMEIKHREIMGGYMARWEIVEVHPGKPEVVATVIPESAWRE